MNTPVNGTYRRLTRRDKIGKVVWDIVNSAVAHANKGERVTFMLAGLTAEALEGIAHYDTKVCKEKRLELKINPRATDGLQIDAKYLSDESPVHWRHYADADVVIFAPSDAEREAIGAGLGPVARIDESRIIDEIGSWVDLLNEQGEAKSYLELALKGLSEAREVCLDLQMWLDFISALEDEGFAYAVDLRIKAALPALQIPRDGTARLPAFVPSGNPRLRSLDFANAFRDGRHESGVYATMMTPKHERVDVDTVRARVDAYPHGDEEDVIEALDAVRALLDDADNIVPGGWRPSQEQFCRKVSWTRIGASVFGSARKTTTRSLGKRTLTFIEGNYRHDLTGEEREALESMPTNGSREPSDVEAEFFSRWRERLAGDVRLFKAWQKRLFFKEVVGRDLLSAFGEGFEALVIAGESALMDMDEPRILVRTTHHAKASFWESLDREVYRLFLFELRALRALLGEHVKWDLETAEEYPPSEESGASDGRRIDLELYLVRKSELPEILLNPNPPTNAPRVKTTWQPGRAPKDEPITLALVDDIEALASCADNGASLFRPLEFAPRASSDDKRLSSTTLFDRNSLSDVTQSQQGRTFDVVVRPQDCLLAELERRLFDGETSRLLDSHTVQQARAAIEAFDALFREAVQLLAKDPGKAFSSDILNKQANAFGALCAAGRVPASAGQAGQEIRRLIAQIGVIASDGSDAMAIIPGWHPLRLAEYRAKIVDLASFIESVLTSPAAREADLSAAFEGRRVSWPRWVFPEAAFVHRTTMIAAEDLGGYSLMVPADSISRSQEALEASASLAAGKFMQAVDQYLEIHPHEATNLSIAIFDSESQTLPREIAREMAKRLHKEAGLRCDLIITHRDQERLRRIYRNQNVRLGAENISQTARGFLSRLRVDVRANHEHASGPSDVRDVDLALLHDAISHHAQPDWVVEVGSSDNLSETFDPASGRRSRRRVAEPDATGVGIYLTLPTPPRAVGQYSDLLFELAKGFLPPGFRGAMIRQVGFDDVKVGDMVTRAHNLADWVITYDKVASATLLQRYEAQIISDVTVPGAEGRVIISSGRVDARLKRNIQDELQRTCDISTESAEKGADDVIRDVLRISGQKVLSAARHANSAREMIGLAVMRICMEEALRKTTGEPPIWISLDDHRGWFMSEKGPVADAIAVSIEPDDETFVIRIQVGEAKFVEQLSAGTITTEARKQVSATTKNLSDLFIRNKDGLSKTAACARLADLLVNREGLSRRFPDAEQRAAFLEALSAGAVRFEISGEAVICLHDAHSQQWAVESEPEQPHLRWHILGTQVIRQLLKRASLEEQRDHGLTEIIWFGARPNGEPPIVAPVNGGPPSSVAHGEKANKATIIESDFSNLPEGQVPSAVFENPILSGANGASGTGAPGHIMEPEDPQKLRRTAASIIDVPTAPAQPPELQFIPRPVWLVLDQMVPREPGSATDADSLAWAEEIARDTQKALSGFRMQAEFAETGPRLTPNGALITFRGHPTLTVAKIEHRTSELLTTHGIEVADIRPGPGRISIFVKRENRATVPLASTWLGARWPHRAPGECTSLIIGAREDEDSLLFLNLSEPFGGYEAHGPHTLIAGETGSGKGILTQSIILQIVCFSDPGQAQLIVIDPKKGVDFTWLEGAPQMKQPIITEIPRAKEALEALVSEMDHRYDRLAAARVANIGEYNDKVAPSEKMSRIFLVHDELGAWMAEDKEYQEVILSSASNLGMKARAAGIHLILITQRADADAVPGRLRDNMGNRLCLKVQNSTGSRMVLGHGGAEKLLGKGHLACVLANQPPPSGQDHFVVQVPFANADDFRALAAAAEQHWRGTHTDN